MDLLTDENLSYIVDSLPRELATAPYMFYLAALKNADDDGAFDLNDGIVFSRLMKVGTPEDVFNIANLMMERRLITRVGESTMCLIVDWDYAPNEIPRSLDQRRQQVKYKIEQAEKLAAAQMFSVCGKLSQKDEPSFFCPENDKNAKNVTIKVYGNKNAENVTENRFCDKNGGNVAVPREKEAERLERLETKRPDEIKKDTHTHIQDRLETEDKTEPPAKDFSDESFYGGGEEKNGQPEEKPDNTETQDFWLDVPAAGDVSDMTERPSHGNRVNPREVLVLFFAKNCKGFNELSYRVQLDELTRRMKSISDERNPPDIVAEVFCQQFEKLVSDGYYKDMPLLPDNMLKRHVYERLNAMVGRILFTGDSKNPWLEDWIKKCADYTPDGNPIDDAYRKYGIDPSSPNAYVQLLAAQRKDGGEPP